MKNFNDHNGSFLNENHPKQAKNWFSYLGPGFITAALVFGPGSLTVISKLGAGFGNAFLWIIAIATFFMIVFVGMSIRIGLATEVSLLTTIRQRWGKEVSAFIGISIFLVVVSFQAGNTVGAGLAFSELSGTVITPWILFVTVFSISLLYFKSFYKILEKLMLLLVSVMFVSFLGTLLIIRPDFTEIMMGFVPSLPAGSLLLAIALVASSFSIVGAFYQSYLVQEKGWEEDQSNQAKAEGISGIVMLGVIGGMILICAGSVLNPLNVEINSAADMGLAIEPLFGRFAKVLFMIGLFGASFSSLIGNATIGGTLLSDALGYGSRLSNTVTRLFIMLVMVAGASIAVWFGGIPIDLIVFAQGITIFIVPFIGIVLFMTANSKEILGNLRNGPASQVAGYVGIAILFVLAFRNAYLIFS
jgi:NRAMP (natural resistance-associated macrophage protein)-like metal ion transporter